MDSTTGSPATRLRLSLSRPIKTASNGVPDKEIQTINAKEQQNFPDLKIRYVNNNISIPKDSSPQRIHVPRIQMTCTLEKKHRNNPARRKLRKNDDISSGWTQSLLFKGKAPTPPANKSTKRINEIRASDFDPINYCLCFKIIFLVMVWLFCLIVFILYEENKTPLLHSSFIGTEKKINFPPRTDYGICALVEVYGPFLSVHKQHQTRYPIANDQMELPGVRMFSIKLSRDYDEGDEERFQETSDDELIVIKKGHLIDFNEGVLRYAYLTFRASPSVKKEGVDDAQTDKVYGLRISLVPKEIDTLVPFAIRWSIDYRPIWLRVLCAFIIMLFLYVLLVIDVNRTLALIFTSTVALAILSILEMRPSFYEMVSWLDIEPIMVVFSVMLISGVAAETGFYDVIGVVLFKVTDGRVYSLIALLCIVTGIMTFFVSNVVTMIIMAPVAIRACEIMDDDMDPVPVLLSMVMISNVCGVGTPMGSLASMLIASNKWVLEAKFSYWIFVQHMIPAVVLACLLTAVYLTLLFGYVLPEDLTTDEEPNRLGLWKHVSEAIPNVSRYWHMVKEEVDSHLNVSKGRSARKAKVVENHYKRRASELEEIQIVNWCLLLKALAAIVFAIILILLQSSNMEPFLHVTLGWSCMCAAILLLIMMNRQELEPVLHRVSWCTLLSLAALAVLTQIVYHLTYHAEHWKKWFALRAYNGEPLHNLVILLMCFWIIGLCSAFFNNLLVVTSLLHTMLAFGSDFYLRAPVSTFISALAIGAGFGANGCILGSAANIIAVDMANQQGYKITMLRFLIFGGPIMFGNLLIGYLYIIVHYFIYK